MTSPRPIPPPRRLLVIPLRFIGDTVVSAPLIRTLRQTFPEARLEAMTSELTRPLLAPCPYLDAVWPEPGLDASDEPPIDDPPLKTMPWSLAPARAGRRTSKAYRANMSYF